jgi:hypothetical protein
MARVFTALVSTVLLVATSCGGTKDGGKLRWERDPAKASTLAHSLGRPMLLYFTSDG